MMRESKEVRQLDAVELPQYKEEFSRLFYDSHLINFPDHPYSLFEANARYETMLSYLSQGKGQLVAIVEETELIGFLWYFRKDRQRIHINEIAVSTRHRSQGLGRLLLETVLEQAKAQGIPQAELFVTCSNQVAVNFYTKNKFKPERLLLVKQLLEEDSQM